MLRQFLIIHPYLSLSSVVWLWSLQGSSFRSLCWDLVMLKNLVLFLFYFSSSFSLEIQLPNSGLGWAVPTKSLCRAQGQAGPEHSAAGSCICHCWLWYQRALLSLRTPRVFLLPLSKFIPGSDSQLKPAGPRASLHLCCCEGGSASSDQAVELWFG